MSQKECPVCGNVTFEITRGEYDIPDESGAKKLSPDVGGCISCGFYYQEDIRDPFEDQARRYKNRLESGKKLEKIIEDIGGECWTIDNRNNSYLCPEVRGKIAQAILHAGFDKLTLERIIDWWLRNYPDDVFIKQPEEIVAIRELMEKIKWKGGG